jgi:hypothetical protein
MVELSKINTTNHQKLDLHRELNFANFIEQLPFPLFVVSLHLEAAQHSSNNEIKSTHERNKISSCSLSLYNSAFSTLIKDAVNDSIQTTEFENSLDEKSWSIELGFSHLFIHEKSDFLPTLIEVLEQHEERTVFFHMKPNINSSAEKRGSKGEIWCITLCPYANGEVTCRIKVETTFSKCKCEDCIFRSFFDTIPFCTWITDGAGILILLFKLHNIYNLLFRKMHYS